jgi:two-component system KDP operon response regulator KdpE
VTRRGQAAAESGSAIAIGDNVVDLGTRSITRDGAAVRLSPTEWRLLEYLLRHPGKLLSQRSLLHDVWGPQYLTESNYLRQYMARLRRKLELDPAHPRHLLTEPGMGYRFRP